MGGLFFSWMAKAVREWWVEWNTWIWSSGRLEGTKRGKKIVCVSEKFAPVQVIQRVAVWLDLSLCWGLVHPPTALAGLLYISVEIWTYGRAVDKLQLQFRREDLKAEIPKAMMVFWLAMASFMAGMHFASILTPEPGWKSLVMSLLPPLLMWACCLRLPQLCSEAQVPQHAHLELADRCIAR
eukprot:TRINITY_DN17630_c0_g3_i1.p1 TRINITY_DN17630_c0_g3~~TRINITY_DN17630_c0_g3_i1.p1  ORF type:complete len:182 (-),score=31.01 TRINITY_DN17630_c0_g3_i1:71-616(-)